MRAGECCALDWKDVKLERGLLHVRHSYSKRSGMKSTKSGKPRTVPINPILGAALRSYHERLGEPESGPVLLSEYGKRLKANVVSGWHWPRICIAAGLADQTNRRQLHHRHASTSCATTAASFWLAEGMPLDQVSDLLGHGNVNFTRRVYIHQLEHDERAKRALNHPSTRFVHKMAQLGVMLPASEPLYFGSAHAPDCLS